MNELKVAKTASDVLGLGLADKDLVAMVTNIPAKIVKWDRLVGSIAVDKRPDLIVITTTGSADDYTNLIDARETDLVLIMVNGQPIVGTALLMSSFGKTGENIKLGSTTRTINYGAGDPRVPKLTFAQAQAAMADALLRLPTLLEDENKGHGVVGRSLVADAEPKLRLALDEEHPGHYALRPRLPFEGELTGPDAAFTAAAKKPVPPKSQVLDPPSVADDPMYGATIQGQMNIPTAIKAGLKSYY